MATGEREYSITKSDIQKNWTFIKESVSFSAIADHMLEWGILNLNDHRNLKYDIINEGEKMDKFLYLLFKENKAVWQKFAEALELTDQSFVVDVLEGRSIPPVTSHRKEMHIQRAEPDGKKSETMESSDRPITMKDLQTALQQQNEHFETVLSHSIGRHIINLQKEIEDRIERQNIEVKDLEEQIQSEKKTNESIKKALEKKSQECHKLQNENKFLKKQVEAWSIEAKSVDEYSQLRDTCSQLEQKRKELESKLQTYKKSETQNLARIQSLNKAVGNANMEIQQWKQYKENQKLKFEDERVKYLQHIQENEKKITSLGKKIKTLEQSMQKKSEK